MQKSDRKKKEKRSSLNILKLGIPVAVLLVYLIFALQNYKKDNTQLIYSHVISELERGTENIAVVLGSCIDDKMPDEEVREILTTKFFQISNELSLTASSSHIILDKKGNILVTSKGSRILSGTNIADADNFIVTSPATLSTLLYNLENNRSSKCNVTLNDAPGIMVYRPIYNSDYYILSITPKKYIDQQLNLYTSLTGSFVWKIYVALIIFVVVLVNVYINYKINLDKKNLNLVNEAETDQLTRLFNKISTQKYINKYLDEQNVLNQSGGLLFLIDIDNFKNVNDTRGHAFGDLVLSSIGTKLSTSFRATDIAGRIGGDEFLVFVKNVNDEKLIQQYANRISDIFSYFAVGEYSKYIVTASIGMSVYPKDGTDFMTLYKNADKAVYVSKRNGKNQLNFYDPSMSGEKGSDKADMEGKGSGHSDGKN